MNDSRAQDAKAAAPSVDWLLLHGVPLAGSVWQEVANELAPGGECRHPDLAPDIGAGSLQSRCAQTLVAALDAAPRAIDLVGHSFGAQVAVELALARPSKVRSLVIACSRDRPFPAFAALARTIRSGAPFDVDATLARWFRVDELAADGAAVRAARACLLRLDRARYADALDAIAQWDRTAERARLALPVTLIAAQQDPVATPAAMREWAQGLPNARLVLIEVAAHMSVFTRPAEFAALLRAHRDWAVG